MTSIEWKNATPEQHNLWKYARGLLAYTTITPLCYTGPLAASEYLTYNAGKLYVALKLEFYNLIDANAGVNELILYNMANAVKLEATDMFPVWDTTAAVIKYSNGCLKLDVECFSRVQTSGGFYTYIRFNGFRLNV